MRRIFEIVGLIIISSTSYSQDTLWMEGPKYMELTERVTLIFHKNGVLGKKYIKKGTLAMITKEWDENGHFIKKSKSGKKLLSQKPYYQSLRLEYHKNGMLKKKSFGKTVGCNHFKRRWSKHYSDDGKRTTYEK